MNLLSGLNDKQREAAQHDKGPALVIAGAGTGKTRVLTHRIAHLVQSNSAKPYEILSITFTNKAANEMKERIGQLIEYDVDKMWVGTFHSICVRILRRNIERIGYGNNFVIYDTNDQKLLVKDCIKELDLDPKKYAANSIRGRISHLKNDRISSDEYINENYSSLINRNIGEVYSLYQKKLKISNALDFDDLLIKALELLERNNDLLEYYQDRFKYILVDEYQDTNRIQYKLVKLIGNKKDDDSNVFVVGDEDQSIYGWRGADINNILDFEKDFKGAKVIKLERNYRSTDVILNAANSVIKNNFQRKGKNLWTNVENGEQIKVIETNNEKEEAFMIGMTILKENRENNIDYSDMAILYRTNAQSRALEERFMRESVPYKIVGGLKFYGRKEIKDILAYLMLIQNPKDNISFKRIINVPRRKIGKKTVEIIEQYANKNDISLFEAAYEAENMILSSSALKNVQNFTEIISLLMIKKDAMDLSDFIEAVYNDTGYSKMLESDDTIEGRGRLENINEFLSAAVDFEERYIDNTLADYLSHISLLSDIDKTDENLNNCVTLLTVHSAKGLEFDVVVIAGLEEKMFPIIKDMDENNDIEEERRLFYVAITRAKKRLYLSYANERIVFGNHENRIKSRFIKEIPYEYLNIKEDFAKENAKKQEDSNKSNNYFKESRKEVFKGDFDFFSDIKPNEETKILKSDKIGVGDKIKHKSWGIGTVVQMKGSGEDTAVTVAFENKGVKTLMLSFAPIEKI